MGEIPSWHEILHFLFKRELEEELSPELEKFHTSEDIQVKIQICYRLAMQYKAFPPIIRLKRKSDVKVGVSREQYPKYKGNFCKLYNILTQWITNAEINSRDLSNGYLRRGILLFKEKRYILALVDANRGLNIDVPLEDRTQLEKLKEACVSKIRLSKNEELWNTLRAFVMCTRKATPTKIQLTEFVTDPDTQQTKKRTRKRIPKSKRGKSTTESLESESGEASSYIKAVVALEPEEYTSGHISARTESSLLVAQSKKELSDYSFPILKIDSWKKADENKELVAAQSSKVTSLPSTTSHMSVALGKIQLSEEVREAVELVPTSVKIEDAVTVIQPSELKPTLVKVELHENEAINNDLLSVTAPVPTVDELNVQSAKASLFHDSSELLSRAVLPTTVSDESEFAVDYSNTEEKSVTAFGRTETKPDENVVQTTSTSVPTTKIESYSEPSSTIAHTPTVDASSMDLGETAIVRDFSTSLPQIIGPNVDFDEVEPIIDRKESTSIPNSVDEFSSGTEPLKSKEIAEPAELTPIIPAFIPIEKVKPIEDLESRVATNLTITSQSEKIADESSELLPRSNPTLDSYKELDQSESITGKVSPNHGVEIRCCEEVGQKDSTRIESVGRSDCERDTDVSELLYSSEDLTTQPEPKKVELNPKVRVKKRLTKRERKRLSERASNTKKAVEEEQAEKKPSSIMKHKPVQEKSLEKKLCDEKPDENPTKSVAIKKPPASRPTPCPTSPVSRIPSASYAGSIAALRSQAENFEELCDLNYDWLFSLPRGKLQNNLLPNASAKIKITENEQWGRHMVATQDIKPGELLMIEKAYSSATFPSYCHTHCSNCLARCEAMIPCKTCNLMMYCGEKCRQQAYDLYHRIECQIIEYLDGTEESHQTTLAVRTLLLATNQGENLVKLMKHPVFKHPFRKKLNFNRKCKGGEYIDVHNLEDNWSNDMLSSGERFEKAMLATYLVHLLKHTTFFDHAFLELKAVSKPNYTLTNIELYVGEFLLKHLFAAKANACFMIDKHGGGAFLTDQPQEHRIAAGLFPLISCINHSCDANVIKYDVKDSLVVYAIAPIKAGEQILTNYGTQYHNHEKPLRQQFLRHQFFFVCECPACVENWPTGEFLNDHVFNILEGIDLDPRYVQERLKISKYIAVQFANEQNIDEHYDFLIENHLYMQKYNFQKPSKEYFNTGRFIKTILWNRLHNRYHNRLKDELVGSDTIFNN